MIDYSQQVADVDPIFYDVEDPAGFSFDAFVEDPTVVYTPEPVVPTFFDDSGKEVGPNEFVAT